MFEAFAYCLILLAIAIAAIIAFSLVWDRRSEAKLDDKHDYIVTNPGPEFYQQQIENLRGDLSQCKADLDAANNQNEALRAFVGSIGEDGNPLFKLIANNEFFIDRKKTVVESMSCEIIAERKTRSVPGKILCRTILVRLRNEDESFLVRRGDVNRDMNVGDYALVTRVVFPGSREL